MILRRRIQGLRDSKKLSRLQRERLDVVIRKQAVAFGLGWVTPQELDSLGLTGAVRLAMERAVAEITVPYDEIIIDGNYNFLSSDSRSRCIVKADDSIPAVSAASILAKVARDRYMAEMAVQYPGYFFERHVGYGTKQHLNALQTLGHCNIHRQSFAPIKAYLSA